MPAADPASAHDRQRRLFLIAAIVAAVAFVVVATLVRARAGGGLDGKILFWFEMRRRDPFTGIAVFLDHAGTWWVMGIGVVLLAAVLWLTGRMIQGVYLGVTLAASLTLNLILKIAFQRQPPGFEPVVDASLYAFPSGHTMTTTAVASALAVIAWPTRWRWPVVVLAALFAISMGVSRVYLSSHWPSDVAAGLALGFGVALAVRLLLPWPTPEEAAAAQAEEGAGAAGAPAAGSRSARPAADGKSIDVVFLDWGNTLMVDNGMREGPMKDWASVEAEAGAEMALRGLRARYRIVVATNANDSSADDVRLALARVGLDELVDDVISSADVGDRKPHYAFFRAALLQEGTAGMPLDPARAVMVGDSTTNDITGAQRAGMRTIWYNSTKRRFPAGDQPPDVTIRKLVDLPAAVDRLAGVAPQRHRLRRHRVEAAVAETPVSAAEGTATLRAETAAENATASAAAAVPGAAGMTDAVQAPAPARVSPAASPPASSRPRTVVHPRVDLAAALGDAGPPEPVPAPDTAGQPPDAAAQPPTDPERGR